MFVLGGKSKANLVGVHPHLVDVTKLAIKISDVDFAVHDGKRTEEEQKRNIEKGVSWTMDSRHLTGHAVDNVPWVDGRLSWEWPHCFQVAEAMKIAANALGVPIIWGAVWDRRLNDLSQYFEKEMREYKARMTAKGKNTIKFDGAHFHLDRSVYP